MATLNNFLEWNNNLTIKNNLSTKGEKVQSTEFTFNVSGS